jgi:serine protease
MKSTVLASALGLVLASMVAAAAQPDPNRMIVVTKPGTQAQVEQSLKRLGAKLHLRLDRQRAMSVTLPPAALQRARQDPNIVLIERDWPRYPLAQTVPYGIPKVQAPQAVAVGADGTGIKVCVIDSGIHAGHEDFAGVAMTGYASPGQNWNNDNCGHGTHVAGTIAAVDNSVGVIGVSPGKVSLHIVKVFDGTSCGWSYASSLVDAANRCRTAGAKVINMSLGGGGPTNLERDTFAELQSLGVLSIAAAGNNGTSSMLYPASYDAVMSVAATDINDAKASFSQFNSQVEIAAPGVNVLSTYPTRSATVLINGNLVQSNGMEGSVQATTSGQLVHGQRCLAADPVAWAGKVVLCERGDATFWDKTLNVQTSGGVGVIVYNNVPGNFMGTLAPNTSTIPVVSISQEDGVAILAISPAPTADVSTVAQYNVSEYGSMNGTSMATPHVAGVAALAWSAFPGATAVQVRNALTSTALDLGATGRDHQFGFGLVQALAATDALLQNALPTGLSVTWSAKLRGKEFRLAWSGGGSSIDVWRNGSKLATISNSGAHVDQSNIKSGHGTMTYRVCNAGTTDCSANVSVNY